jgi:hypothetical protein
MNDVSTLSKQDSQAGAQIFIHKSVIPAEPAPVSDCRNPDYMEVHSLPSMALDTRFPAGMTSYQYICNRSLRTR